MDSDGMAEVHMRDKKKERKEKKNGHSMKSQKREGQLRIYREGWQKENQAFECVYG